MSHMVFAFIWSSIYAALGTLSLSLISNFVMGCDWRQIASTAFAVLLFVFLALTPLPAAGTLLCPVPQAEANLVPFEILRALYLQWVYRVSIPDFLGRSVFATMAGNVAIPAVIGMLLVRYGIGFGRAVLLGGAFSVAVELTQLTGVWGLYPCAYRRFDVDDLIFNTVGLAIGFALVRYRATRRSGVAGLRDGPTAELCQGSTEPRMPDRSHP